MSKVPGFIGVFPRDRVPPLQRNTSFIANLHSSNKPGSHWVCAYIPSSGPCEYFDSFGQEPPTEIKKRLQQIAPVIYQNQILQEFESVRCGWYCMHYIIERNKGKDWHGVLYDFSLQPSKQNEKKIFQNFQ